MLHPSRRLWRRRHPVADEVASARRSGAALMAAAEATSCALKALEQSVLGTEREGDVPGFEIPSRYFQYIRTGDARALEGVFEHNRLDLLSLAALTSVVLKLVELGPDAARTSRERLALGRLYELAGRTDRAKRCFECLAASGPGEPGWCRDDARVKAEALRWLAVHHRRAGRHAQAAEAWQQILELGLDHAPLVREASEALAIHHEHRSKNLDAARTFALRALDVDPDPRSERELEHRLDRLKHKMKAGGRLPATGH
jgi:tetratricopeptide (TPR) repeat protein